MIRSIAFELFDRLTTDPEALRKQVADARAERDETATELLDYKCGTKGFERNALTSELDRVTSEWLAAAAERDALQLQVRELLAQFPEGMKHCTILYEKCPVGHGYLRGMNWEKHECFICEARALKHKLAEAELEIARLQREIQQLLARNNVPTDTIEPTWILALWSVHAEAWTESHRGSYDAMNEKMRANATQWNLFPRSAWDALVKNGRAR